MRQIEISDEAYERLTFAARVFGVSVGDVVTRLVEAMDGPQPSSNNTSSSAGTAEEPDDQEDVHVHVVYQGHHVRGVFERSTKRLRITSGPLADRIYPSPSAAAIAVVESVNPDRARPETNGRTFWIIDKTGKTLRSIIGRR